MRLTLLAALILIPAFGFLPTADACWGPAPTVDTGVLYVVAGQRSSNWLVQVNDVALGIDVCSWQGAGTATYQESNGIPGLQTSGSCAPDTLVEETFVGARGQCFL